MNSNSRVSVRSVLYPAHSVLHRHLIRAVVLAGESVKKMYRHAEIAEGQGHRSLITEGDVMARDIMVAHLAAEIHGIKILSEEENNNPSLLSKKDPRGILGKGIFGIIDPIDSTVRFAHDMAGWGVAGGVIVDGSIEMSAVYAPADNQGLFVSAARDGGVWCKEWARKPRRISIDRNRLLKESVLLFGVDVTLYRSIMLAVSIIAPKMQAVYTSGSGILGLAKIATGKADVVIQTPQKAWDWATAYRAVIESGNIFQFFRIRDNGDIVPVATYDYEAFCYEPSGRLGYVAGVPSLVQKIWRVLPKTGWQKIDPDTVK